MAAGIPDPGDLTSSIDDLTSSIEVPPPSGDFHHNDLVQTAANVIKHVKDAGVTDGNIRDSILDDFGKEQGLDESQLTDIVKQAEEMVDAEAPKSTQTSPEFKAAFRAAAVSALVAVIIVLIRCQRRNLSREETLMECLKAGLPAGVLGSLAPVNVPPWHLSSRINLPLSLSAVLLLCLFASPLQVYMLTHYATSSAQHRFSIALQFLNKFAKTAVGAAAVAVGAEITERNISALAGGALTAIIKSIW